MDTADPQWIAPVDRASRGRLMTRGGSGRGGATLVAMRLAKRVLAVLVVAAVGYGLLRDDPADPPGDDLTSEDVRALFAALLRRVERNGPNHLHSRRLYFYGRRFAEAAGADPAVVRAAAILHDATKEKGVADPKERFCTHGETGAGYAREVVAGLGKSERFAGRVADAIAEHMGPCGVNWRVGRPRFMSKFCADVAFPAPATPEAAVLYDVDMLDLMSLDGVVKVVTFRQTNPEFGPEPIQDSALTGEDSAWKSVLDGGQTLGTDAARACGIDVTRHSEAFLRSIDWNEVQTLEQFLSAAVQYRQEHPLPECLPPVPS
jgi:hypothetical protein